MDIALSDIALSDVGVHVAGSLAAVIAVDLYKSVFFRDRAGQDKQDIAQLQNAVSKGRASSGKPSRANEAVQRSWLSRLVGWLLMFAFKLFLKVSLALMSAGFVMVWLQEHVNLAVAYRLSAESAETIYFVAFMVVLIVTWWILPIRLFKR